MNERRANEIFGGAFLIGMAILFLLNWWWPGILYVIGFAMMTRAVAQGRKWIDERAGLFSLAIGVVFTLIDLMRFSFNLWPLVLILLGLYLLFGNRRLSGGNKNDSSSAAEQEKPKNDDLV